MAEHFTILLHKVDDAFNVQDTRNYSLYIQFHETSFIYCILDNKRNKFLALQQVKKNELQQRGGIKPSFADFLKSVLTAMPWLKSPYKLVKIAYEGKKNTLIPGPIYDANEIRQYIDFNFSSSPDEKAFADHLVPMDTYNVFSIQESTLSAITGIFPRIRISHMTSILIESIWINYKNRINASRVFLHMREKNFDLMLFDGRQMTYFNSFPHLNAEDVTYYLIFILEQLSINPENISIVLLGNVERSSNLFELLLRYVRQIEFGRRNDTFKFSYVFNQVSPQAFYPLLNHGLCGL